MVLWGMGVAVCAGVAAYFLKQGSADGRLLMTMVAGRAWAGEWLCGHGLGGYAQAYGAAQEAFFAARPGSPLSVVAGSPNMPSTACWAWAWNRACWGPFRPWCWACGAWRCCAGRGEVSAYGWLVLLVSSLFSYPFALWPFLSLAVVWVALAASLEAGAAEVRWWKRTAVWPVVAVGGWCVWNLSDNTARRVEAYEEFRRVRGIQDVAFLEDYRKKYEDLKAYPDFLFTFGTALREAGRYNESNAMLRQGTRVGVTPCFTLMGEQLPGFGCCGGG